MPFTLAHPILVAPLRNTELVMPALVIGSMVPDAGHFIPVLPWGRVLAHSLTGLFTVDLLLGMLLLALWQLVVFPAYESTVPKRWRRWEPPRTPSWKWWLLAVPSVLLGTLTHLGLDAYTHADDAGFLGFFPVMSERVGGWRLDIWVQLIASVLGVIAVLFWARRVWRAGRVPRTFRLSSHLERQILLLLPTTLGAVAAGANLIWLYARFGWNVTLRSYVMAVAVTGGTWLMASVILLSLWWHGRRWVRTRRRAGTVRAETASAGTGGVLPT